jgi:uncharacterized membrane protein YbaN (DUF454 family)
VGIKWLYVTLGLVGAFTPVALLYAINHHRRVPGLFIDLGLLIFTFGLSFIFIPIGIAAGLTVAVILHLCWSKLPSWRRPSKTGKSVAPRQ